MRTVQLTERFERMIDALVASGRYRNASEVLEEGLRLIEDREAREAEKLAALRAAVRVADADIEEGRYREFDSPEALTRYLEELSERVIREATK